MNKKICALALSLFLSACSFNSPTRAKSIGFSRSGIVGISSFPPIISEAFSESRSMPSVSHHFNPSSKSSSSISSSKETSIDVSSSSVASSSSQSPSSSQNSSSSQSSTPNPDPAGDYIFSDHYGPFNIGSNNFDATFTYALNSVASQSIFERIRLFNANNEVVSSSSKTSFSYTKGSQKSVTFTIPIRDYLTSSGLTLSFEILNTAHVIYKHYSVTFYPPSNSTIPGTTMLREKHESKSLGFYGDGSGLKELKETIDFRTFGEYLNVDYYYKLDLQYNAFAYLSDFDLEADDINLRFNDRQNMFPDLQHNFEDDIIIPLSFNKKSFNINFKYKNQFYVNKKTLEIADEYMNNYVLTNDFYLPVNGMNNFNNKTLYIDIFNLGVDNITTCIPIKYNVDHALVSICPDGDYCVTGGNG